MGIQLSGGVENGAQRNFAPLLRIALLLGVLVYLLGFFFFRVTSNPLPSRANDAAFISLIPGDLEGNELELVEQASLFDSAPLFIPGKWSSASSVFSRQVDEELQVFPDFEPGIELLNELKPTRLSLREVEDFNQPSDLLALRFWDIFETFGEAEVTIAPYEEDSGTAIITVIAGDENIVIGDVIRQEVVLETNAFGLRPAIYYLNVSGPGLPLGAPVQSQSSGSDALDAEILAWMMRPSTLAKLPAGFLELRFFP